MRQRSLGLVAVLSVAAVAVTVVAGGATGAGPNLAETGSLIA